MASEQGEPQEERWMQEWHEVQEHRYDKGVYPGDGGVHPFFRKMSRPAPTQRFGVTLLIVGLLLVLSPVLPAARGLAPFAVVFGLILVIGGVGHIRASGASSTSG